MPDLLKQPLVWAGAGVLAIVVVIIIVTRGGSDDGPLLVEAELTSTGSDVEDDLADALAGEGLTEPADDLFDDAASTSPRGLTETVRDADLERPGVQLSAQVIPDSFSECAWLVNVPGQNPAKLFLAAWPTGTEITWDPFTVRVPGQEPLVDIGAQIIGDGIVLDSIDALTPVDRQRLLGLERCENEGVVVLDEDPARLEVGSP